MNSFDVFTGLAGKILNSISAAGFEISALQMVKVEPIILLPLFSGHVKSVIHLLGENEAVLSFHFANTNCTRITHVTMCTILTFSDPD